MGRDDLVKTIKGPADRFDVEIEKKLIDRLVEEMMHKPGRLALLEFVMWKLWLKQTENKITYGSYLNIKKLDRAIADHAEEHYELLGDEEKKQTRKIFLNLIHFDEETSAVLPRVATKAQLNNYWYLVKKLADENHRLLVIEHRKDKEDKEDKEDRKHVVVEVAHEVLYTNGAEYLSGEMRIVQIGTG